MGDAKGFLREFLVHVPFVVICSLICLLPSGNTMRSSHLSSHPVILLSVQSYSTCATVEVCPYYTYSTQPVQGVWGRRFILFFEELNAERPRLVLVWVLRNLSNHIGRQARTGDSVTLCHLRVERWQVGAKHCSNKKHWPHCLLLFYEWDVSIANI